VLDCLVLCSTSLPGTAWFGILLLLLLTGMESWSARSAVPRLASRGSIDLASGRAAKRPSPHPGAGVRQRRVAARRRGRDRHRTRSEGPAAFRLCPDHMRPGDAPRRLRRRRGACIPSPERDDDHRGTLRARGHDQVHANAAPERAIIQEIEAVGADLVVLGVDQLEGEVLDFGAIIGAGAAGLD
jgi:hypothetical protein